MSVESPERLAPVHREIHFMCCICGNEVVMDDPEVAQIVLVHPAPIDSDTETHEQYWWCHRKPCFEQVLQPQARDWYDEGVT